MVFIVVVSIVAAVNCYGSVFICLQKAFRLLPKEIVSHSDLVTITPLCTVILTPLCTVILTSVRRRVCVHQNDAQLV